MKINRRFKLCFKFVQIAFITLLIPNRSLLAQDYKNEKQLIKNAETDFNAGKFVEAMPQYSNLVSKYAKDPNFNYRYGACLLFAGADKEKPLSYLTFAVSRPEVDPDAHYYLGLAQHLNYQFDKAIIAYNNFKTKAKPEQIKTLDIDNKINQCKNGKGLLSNITDLIVLDKQSLGEGDFYKVYDLSEFGGQILSKPDDFKTDYEKKSAIESILFLPKGRDTLFYSGIEGPGKSRDIYMSVRKSDGVWSTPSRLSKTVNSDLDEDFAFFHPNEQRLYFASKGHNSLGGYDVFTSKYNNVSGTWGPPVNLDFAINTPADDYMLITDKSGTRAFFASNRESPSGMVNVYRINLQRIPLDFALIYGHFSSETTKKAIIRVENAETGEKIGEFHTDETGTYKLRVPNDGKFKLLVDYTNSNITHSGELELKNRNSFKPLKQEMVVMNQGTDNETLVIKNLFDEEVAEAEPIITADFLKEKARLEVNEEKYRNLKPELIAQEAPPPVKESESKGPEIVSGGEQGAVVVAETSSVPVKSEMPANNTTPVSMLSSAPNSKAVKPGSDKTPEAGPSSAEQTKPESLKSETTPKSVEASGKGRTSRTAKAGSNLKLKPSANPGNSEIAEVASNNVLALRNDAEILRRESDIAAVVASSKGEKSAALKRNAVQLISGKDTNSASVKASLEYKESREKFQQAAFLDREAATAARLADNLKESAATADKSHQMADDYAQGIQNNLGAPAEDNIKRFNQLSGFVETQLTKEVRLTDIKQEAENRRSAKSVEAADMRQKADEINDKITGLERNLIAKQGAVSDARGQAKRTLEEQIAADRATIESEKIRLLASLKKAEQAEAEAIFIEHEIAVVDEILDAGEKDEIIAEKISDSFVGRTDGTQNVEPEPAGKALPSGAKVDDKPQTTAEPKSPKHEEPVVQQTMTTVTDTSSRTVAPASQAVAFDPVILKSDKPYEPTQEMLLDELVWNDAQLEEKEKALLPIKPTLSELSTAFKSEKLAASLSLPDQSLRSVMYEGYHREYMNKYGEIAEIEDPLLRTAQTYVVNENWLTDILREENYLKSLERKEGIDSLILKNRVESLEKLADLKRNAMLRSRSQLADAIVNGTPSETIVNQVNAYRDLMKSGPVKQDNMAQNSTPAATTQQPVSQLPGKLPDEPLMSSLVQSEKPVSADSISESKKSDGIKTFQSESATSNNTTTTDSMARPLQPEIPKTAAKPTEPMPSTRPLLTTGTESIPATSSPDNNEKHLADGYVSELRPLPESLPQAKSAEIMTQKQREIADKKEKAATVISQLKAEEQQATIALQSASKKDREISVRRVHDAKKALAVAQEEQQFREYSLEQLAKTADMVVFGPQSQEMPSIQEKQRSVQLKKEAESLRAEANTLAALKPPRNKKKKMAHMDNVFTKDIDAARAEQKATSSIQLIEELSEVENKILHPTPIEPVMLSVTGAQPTPEDFQQVPQWAEYKTYDSLRTVSDRYFKDARMMDVRSKDLSSEISEFEKAINQTNELLSKSDDPARRASLETELSEIVKRKLAATDRLSKMEKNSVQFMTSSNLLRNAAIAHLESATEDRKEKLKAMAVVDEASGRFAYSALSETDKKLVSESMSKDDFSSILRGESEIPSQLQEAVFEMIEFNKSLYSSENPIPMDSKLPEGLVFKVQIGAFRNPPPQDIFKGFAPVRGESTRPGWIRYTAGVFSKKEQAQLKRSELRTLGYSDAFVVAYLNGQRITMAEADAMLNSEGAVQPVLQPDNGRSGTSSLTQLPAISKVETIKGVLYTVQVGAYSKPVSNAQVYNLSPLIEYQANGLYKYGSGIYPDAQTASIARTDIVNRVGVRDAFVAAFADGRRVSLDEADRLVASGKPIAGNQPSVSVQNSSKSGNIIFSIQLGAYRGEVPVEDAKSILVFTNLGIDIKEESGLTQYLVGSYKNYDEAKQMSERIKAEGLPGAFVVAFSGGRKMDLQQAINLSK